MLYTYRKRQNSNPKSTKKRRLFVTGSSSAPDGRRRGWKLIWACDIPPTVHNFVWRVAVDSLPTWQNKYKRGLEIDGRCPLCVTEVEDNFHPFIRCPLARELWFAMAEVWALPEINDVVNTGKEWLLHALEPLPDIERSMLLMTL